MTLSTTLPPMKTRQIVSMMMAQTARLSQNRLILLFLLVIILIIAIIPLIFPAQFFPQSLLLSIYRPSKQCLDQPIPPIIHQSWKTKTLPKKFHDWSNSWKIKHPGWRYILWTDEENDAFVQLYFPWFWPTYSSFGKKIQKVDSVRYMCKLRTYLSFTENDYYN